ncbi:MAG: thioredoxin family protein [Planctomycetota bacterium]
MRALLAGLAATVLLAAPVCGDGEGKKEEKKKIEWVKVYADGLKQAQAEKKAILLFISSDSYMPSKTFQSKFFGGAEVIASAEKVVCIKVDSAGKDKAVLEKYQVKKGPDVRFLDYNEAQLGATANDLKKPEEMVELIEKAAQYCADMASAIEWITNYDTALAQAKEQHKPIFVDFSTEW